MGSGPILKSPNGNLEIIAIYNNHHDKTQPNRAVTIPEVFNDRNYRSRIVSYGQLRPFFVDEGLWRKNEKILTAASPIVTSTVGAFSKNLPLDDTSLRDDNGKIYIEGEWNGKTRFGGFSVDQLVKAGIKVDIPGVFLVMEKGYVIEAANESGTNYTMRVPHGMLSGELKLLLHAFYGDFKNKELRRTDNALGIPVGDIVTSPPGQDAIYFRYLKPGPAIPGHVDNLGYWEGRFEANFGYAYNHIEPSGYGRFGAAVIASNP